MRSSKYTAELLAPIVASSHSLSDVIRKLGIMPNGGNHRMISALVRRHGLDTSHFGWGKLRKHVEAVPVDHLAQLVAQSTSYAQVLMRLDLPTEGRAHRELTKRVEHLGLDTSHFRGRGWSRGETAESHPTVARISERKRRHNDEVFIENSPDIKGPALCKRLLAMGWRYECSECGLVTWRGQPLVLHVDHKNGINNDNRLTNLRFLCPNCHSQTETYCNRRRPTASRACEPRAPYTCYRGERTRAWRNWQTPWN